MYKNGFYIFLQLSTKRHFLCTFLQIVYNVDSFLYGFWIGIFCKYLFVNML